MYPIYSVPPVPGASVSLGGAPSTPVQPDDQRFCTLDDAKVILKVFTDLGVADAQLIDASVGTVGGVHFSGVPASSPARPWYLFSSVVTGPVGPALWIQYGPNSINGGGRGNPGSWTGVLTGNPQYVPTPVSTMPATPMTVDSSKDPAALAAALGVPVVTFGTTQDARLTNIERLVIAMAGTIGIK